jgi:hypothetical protein
MPRCKSKIGIEQLIHIVIAKATLAPYASAVCFSPEAIPFVALEIASPTNGSQ